LSGAVSAASGNLFSYLHSLIILIVLSVIPAKAGIHSGYPFDSFPDLSEWIPAFAGMTKAGELSLSASLAPR